MNRRMQDATGGPGLAAGYAAAPPPEPAHVDLSALSTSDIERLLANLRSRGQASLVAALEHELRDRLAPAGDRGRAARGGSRQSTSPRRASRVALAAGGAAAVAAVLVGLAFSRWDHAPHAATGPLRADAALLPPPQSAGLAPQSAGLARAVIPSDGPAYTGRGDEAPAGRTALATNAVTTARHPIPLPSGAKVGAVTAVRSAPAAPLQLARLDAAEVDETASPPPIETPRPPPPAPRAMRLALPAEAAQGAPLIVSRGAAANLLGAPSPRTDALAGVRSGNPVRMATAVTAVGP